MTIFNGDFNSFCRKYLVMDRPSYNSNRLNFDKNYRNVLGDLFERLLLCEKISIKEYGENISLAILINELGSLKLNS
jgi:hypothetical protein